MAKIDGFMSTGLPGFGTCCMKNCKNKPFAICKIDDVMKGIPVEKLYPFCKKHLPDEAKRFFGKEADD